MELYRVKEQKLKRSQLLFVAFWLKIELKKGKSLNFFLITFTGVESFRWAGRISDFCRNKSSFGQPDAQFCEA